MNRVVLWCVNVFGFCVGTARAGTLGVCAVALMSLATTGVANADQTPALRITAVDSLHSQAKFISLQGYSNPSCDGHRIYLESSDAEYFKQMFAIALSAFHAGTPVIIVFTVSAGQCRGSRVIAYNQ